jgi:hypothetical protein
VQQQHGRRLRAAEGVAAQAQAVVAGKQDRAGLQRLRKLGSAGCRHARQAYRLCGRFALVAATLLAAPAPSGAEPLDRALYAALLIRHTKEVADTAGTRVDYRALAASADWRRLVAGLAAAEPSVLRARSEQLAFWIDVYNVLAIDLVVGHPEVSSIRQIGSLWRPVWKREAGRVGGRAVSLGEIEHAILRRQGEPRIHGAIVCASVSCPALRREPFDPARLDAQLDDAMRRFLASPSKGLRLERERGVVRLSRIFDWFEADFEPEGVLAFVSRYLSDADRAFLEAQRPRIEYFDYHWGLNAWPAAPE